MVAIRKETARVDFQGYQSLNQVLENLAAAPTPKHAGHVYFDTVVGRLRLYNGAKWTDAGGVTSVTSANTDLTVTDDSNGNLTLTLNSSTASVPDSLAKRDASGNIYAANLSGVNTGDQTISLTGEATGSGTGAFAVTLDNSAVIGKVLTGLSTAAGGTVSATDSIVAAIGKLENRMAVNDAKQAGSSLTASKGVQRVGDDFELVPVVADRALVSDANGLPTASAATATEIGYLSGVTSGIQGQIDTLTTGLGTANAAIAQEVTDRTSAINLVLEIISQETTDRAAADTALQTLVDGLQTGKEASITAGTADQYWNGLKQWATLDTAAVVENAAGGLYFKEERVLASKLTGVTGSYLAATDSILEGFDKLSAAIGGLNTTNHTQNTDLGTSSETFYIGGPTGPKLKNNAGTFELVTTDETGFADLRVKNLTVQGTLTQTNSNEVNIGDSQITLNADVATATANSNGGIAVKRLAADNVTLANGELNFDVSQNRWVAVTGPTNALVTSQVALKRSFQVGDGTATAFTINHNLGSKWVSVSVQDAATGEIVGYAVTSTTENSVVIEFAEAPAVAAYQLTVVA